jgi:hypothetical protein
MCGIVGCIDVEGGPPDEKAIFRFSRVDDGGGLWSSPSLGIWLRMQKGPQPVEPPSRPDIGVTETSP